MLVEFTKTFEKQLSSIKDEKLLSEISACVQEVMNAKSIIEIGQLKKLKGYKTAYRIRTGNYRIGIYIESTTVIFAAILHRKDIYRSFP